MWLFKTNNLSIFHEKSFNYKYKICHLDNYTSKHRIGGASSKNILKMIYANYEAYETWRNNGIKISKLFLLKKPFSKIKQFFKK